MALIISQQPQELTPAYNDQFFTALSDQIAMPDFYYIVTCIVNGDSANTFEEHIEQDPNGYMVFNAKEKSKNYIKHHFNPTLNAPYPIQIATDKSISVEVNISEFYSGSIQSTLTVVYNAFDACLPDGDFRDYDFNDYLFGTTPGKWFLSKTVDTITPDNRITNNQDLWLHFFNKGTIPIDSISIKEINTLGVAVDLVSIATLPTPTIAYDMYVLNVGTSVLSNPTVGNRVRVDFLDIDGVSILRYTYTIKELCTIYTPYKIYYLDRDGNILFFNFEKASKVNYTKSISTVKLDKNSVRTGIYSSDRWAPEVHAVSTEIKGSLTLNTDWINELQSYQLIDCWASVQRYLYDGSIYRAVQFTEAPYEQHIEDIDPLFNYTCTIDLGTETAQRGI